MSTQVYMNGPAVAPSSTEANRARGLVERAPRTFPARWATIFSFVFADVTAMLLLVLVSVGLVAVPLGIGAAAPLVLQVVVPAGLLLMIAFAIADLYRVNSLHPAKELRMTAILTSVVFTAFGAGLYLFAPPTSGLGLTVISATITAMAVVPITRGLFRAILGRCTWWGVPAAVVAASDTVDSVLETLQRWPELGLKPVGVVSNASATEIRSVPIVGRDEHVLPKLRRKGISHVVLSGTNLTHAELAEKVARYRSIFTHVSVVPAGPDTPALWTSSLSWEGLGGHDVVSKQSEFTSACKRVLDVLGATALLVLLAPLWLTIAALIKLDSPGPIFFKQERMGVDGKPFSLIKFRTMYEDAESRLHDILDSDPGLRAEYEEYHKLKNDPRVTGLGEILRRLSLDEFPQLINVLRGEMSLVGPRAYVPAERRQMRGHEKEIWETKPGITGLWQVAGRNELTFDERVHTEVHYARNWSIWMDLYILVRTVPVVFTGEGAC